MKVKNLTKTKMFQVEGNIWTIKPYNDGSIGIELCMPGEEELTHPEGNGITAQVGEQHIYIGESLILHREIETCDTCGLDVPGPHPHAPPS